MTAANRLAFPKPEPRRKAKGRKQRREATVLDRVWKAVKARDGRCRLAGVLHFGACAGKHELAHAEGKRRFRTRGQAADERHQTAFCLLLCSSHHRLGEYAYDAHRMYIEMLTPRGADGPLRFRTHDGAVWEEQA